MENEKPKRQRKNKQNMFKEERQKLINELNEIIGISANKNYFILHDIDNDNVKNKIKKLVPEVKKYYKYGSWHYFKEEEKQDEIGLLKTIYKYSDYILTNKKKILERDGIKKQHTEIHINKKIY